MYSGCWCLPKDRLKYSYYRNACFADWFLITESVTDVQAKMQNEFVRSVLLQQIHVDTHPSSLVKHALVILVSGDRKKEAGVQGILTLFQKLRKALEFSHDSLQADALIQQFFI